MLINPTNEKEVEASIERMTQDALNTLLEITPIFKVSFTTQNGRKTHFANFYGKSFDGDKNLSQKDVQAKVQEENAVIFEIISQLEEQIKTGKYKNVKPDLEVEVVWEEFAGYLKKSMAMVEDFICCETLSKAIKLFERAYKSECKAYEQKKNDFLKSLNATFSSPSDIENN